MIIERGNHEYTCLATCCTYFIGIPFIHLFLIMRLNSDPSGAYSITIPTSAHSVSTMRPRSKLTKDPYTRAIRLWIKWEWIYGKERQTRLLRFPVLADPIYCFLHIFWGTWSSAPQPVWSWVLEPKTPFLIIIPSSHTVTILSFA